MNFDFDTEKPIYLQIADEIEDAVFTGAFLEETQIPSTTEISLSYKINPATVLKGMNILVENNIIYKKRGIGMFVAEGAKIKIKQKRQKNFFDDYITKVVSEANKLNLTKDELIQMIERGFLNEHN
ncbi:MAG: transcriptional regulator, GntR family [Clostridia bacterium]|nr:transcriptional regulator, GntR family [Clostridia bacterium]